MSETRHTYSLTEPHAPHMIVVSSGHGTWLVIIHFKLVDNSYITHTQQ
jgi:hypothetical protein